MSPKRPENYQRVITKPRIIAGLLSEIDAAEVLLIFGQKGVEKYQTARIESEFRVPFETSVVRLKGVQFKPGTYSVSALFAGQRLSFDLEVLGPDGVCAFPREIRIVDLRRQKRRKFGPEIEFAEIFTETGVVMATPIDMSQNSIALMLVTKGAKLLTGQEVRLLIRGDTAGRDIFAARLTIKDFHERAGVSKVLLGPIDPRDDVSGQGRLRVVPRHEIGFFSMVLGPSDDHLGEPVLVAVTNISLTGFQCKIADAGSLAWVMAGTSVTIKELDLTATIVWADEGRAGLRVNALDDSETLTAWAELLRGFKVGAGFHHSQVDELVNLFTESGLLKGSRRKIYGQNPAGFLPPERMSENPLLYHRITARGESSRIEGHISMVRLCDDLWFFQEATHSGEQARSFGDLYVDTIFAARNLYWSSKLAPRFFGALYHADIKSTDKFSSELFTDRSSRVYQLMQISISRNIAEIRAAEPIQALAISDLDADARREAMAAFDATLVEAFAGVNGSHPRLNAELAKLGPHHEARTLLVKSGTRVVGLAFRLKSYYSLNSTGVMNSVFLIMASEVAGGEIRASLRHLAAIGFSFGTDDAAVIACQKPGKELEMGTDLVNHKPFTFFIIDNRLNQVFLGAKVESADEVNYRRKGQKQ